MTVEKMLAGQRSPRNHIIMEVLRDYGYVDARGMGVRTKVIPALKSSGAHWDVEATDDFVKTTVGKATETPLFDKNLPQSASILSGKRRESVGKVTDVIMLACQESPSVTIPELASLLGITERSVQRHIQKLQQTGRLARVGGRKNGYWEVVSTPLFRG
jgi:ATP-dependent DNA helicase RecG